MSGRHRPLPALARTPGFRRRIASDPAAEPGENALGPRYGNWLIVSVTDSPPPSRWSTTVPLRAAPVVFF